MIATPQPLHLGALYLNGRGGADKTDLGLLLLHFAAITGPAGDFETARIYGVGSANFVLANHFRNLGDEKQALFFFHWAKRRLTSNAKGSGNGDAQIELGLIYLDGINTKYKKEIPGDLVEAYKWLSLAAMSHPIPERREAAALERDRALEQMDATQKAQSEKAMAGWIKLKGNRTHFWQDRTGS